MAISPIAPPASHGMVNATEVPRQGEPVMQTQNHTSLKPDMALAVPSVEETAKAIELLNKAAQLNHTAVNFQVDESSGKLIVTVVDTEKNEVIRQIPSSEAISLSRAINEQQGILLKTKI